MTTPVTFYNHHLADDVIRWQKQHGRHDLPWQNTQDPYRVWLSEIMLQQTTVQTVIPYYERFLTHFPTIASLSAAPLDNVLSLWAGLGYYTRARNLHRAAQQIVTMGTFPNTAEDIARLPGIGPSTAAAIAVFCFHATTPILDGNVKRVFSRIISLEEPIDRPAAQKILWTMAHTVMPKKEAACYIQGLMDLGATICKRTQPQCARCPLQKHCLAYQQGRPTDFPHKTPKKPKPTKSNHFSLLLSCNHLLLCQHQPTLWQGLWVPPIGPSIHPSYPSAFPTCQPPYAPQYQHRAPTAEWTEKHTFTHFHYEMSVSLWKLPDHCAHTEQEEGWLWLALDQANTHTTIGFPAPVQKWIKLLESKGQPQQYCLL